MDAMMKLAMCLSHLRRVCDQERERIRRDGVLEEEAQPVLAPHSAPHSASCPSAVVTLASFLDALERTTESNAVPLPNIHETARTLGSGDDTHTTGPHCGFCGSHIGNK